MRTALNTAMDCLATDRCPALVIGTDSAGIERLVSQQSWTLLALTPEQLEHDQLLFFNCDTGVLSHIALLKADAPFQPVAIGALSAYRPQIAMVDALLDPLPLNITALRQSEQQLGRSLLLHHQAISLADVDALFCSDPDDAADALIAAIVDQLITSTHHINAYCTLEQLRQQSADRLALEAEFTGAPHGSGQPLSALPSAADGLCPDASQQAALLYLLNSAYA